MAGRLAEWVSEATRRRVFRTVGVYIVAVWGVSTGSAELADLFGVPAEWLRAAIYAAVAAIPVVAFLAWRFDIGREGIVRDPQDVLAEQQRDAELASMPTISVQEWSGAVVIRWESSDGSMSRAASWNGSTATWISSSSPPRTWTAATPWIASSSRLIRFSASQRSWISVSVEESPDAAVMPMRSTGSRFGS